MKRPWQLVLIAIWQFLSVLIMAFFALLYVGLAGGGLSEAAEWEIIFWAIALPSAGVLAYMVVSLAGGISLIKGYEWGRKLSIAHASLSLILFPIGTVVGALCLIYLVRPDTEEYFRASSSGGLRERGTLAMEISPKSRLVTTLLAFFLGEFGAHRFYLGKIGTGIAMLLTLGGLWIWALVDFVFAAAGAMKDKEGKPIKTWEAKSQGS